MNKIYDIIEEEYSSYAFRLRTYDTLSLYLFESRKINDEVNSLAKMLTDIIVSENIRIKKQTGTHGKVFYKFLKNLDIGNNYFIIKPTIIVKVIINSKKAKGESSITPNTSQVIVDDKLYNPIIIIRQYNTEPTIDKDMLEQVITHELMHGYRMLNILLKSIKDGKSRDIKRQAIYNKASDFQNDDTQMVRFIKEAYYITDTDEINANAAEEAKYILLHKDINFYNYRQFLPSIPLYNKINEIKKKLITLDSLIKQNKSYKSLIGSIISRTIYDSSDNENEYIIAFNKMYNRLQRTYTYCIRRFYNVLWATLEKDGRERVMTECRTISIEQLINELKKNRR